MVIRGFLHSWLPWLVDDHAQTLIGRRGVPLSEVYQKAKSQGIIDKQRAINDKIMQDYFE